MNEFRNDLLPLVDSKYRTIADRDHRAFGGFSMGSETTWEVMLNCLNLVKNFMPLSGDCWNNGSDKILKFESWKEGTHCYQYIYEYIYNILAEVF
jgi:enterochelin esterase-like enzyme